MLGFIKKLFGGNNPTDYKDLLKKGAVVLDVRTPQEFKNGHIKGAKNISVQTLAGRLNELNKETTYVTCCKSGMRSANAARILKKNGFTAYNGGGWSSLNRQIH